MFGITLSSNKKIFLAACFGAIVTYGFAFLSADDENLLEKNKKLEERIAALEADLSGHEFNQPQQFAQEAKNSESEKSMGVACKSTANENKSHKTFTKIKIENSTSALKEIETASANDSRSFSDKINELLSANASKENLALAMRSIFNMARDTENASDAELQTIYSAQSNPELKILIAQVLAQRGNSALLDDQISGAKVQLKSEEPKDRQEALNQLAKIHNVKAVDVIAPFLQDTDVNVKLDALQAMRATGNESHVSLVESLANDPEDAVRSLAIDVLSDLKNLSRYARTSISNQDIAAELPIIEN